MNAYDAESAQRAWQQAGAAVQLVLHAPGPLAGLVLQGRHGPVRDALLAQVESRYALQRLSADSVDAATEETLDISATLATGKAVRGADLLGRLVPGKDVLLLVGVERLSLAASHRLCRWLDTAQASVPIIALDESLDDDEAPAFIESALGERLALHARVPDLSLQDLAGLLAEPNAGDAASVSAELPEQIAADLVRLSQALAIASLRAPIAAVSAARASACVAGRTIISMEDAALAAALVLAPRARQALDAPSDAQEDEQQGDAEASADQASQPDETDTPPAPNESDAAPVDAPPPSQPALAEPGSDSQPASDKSADDEPIPDVLVAATAAALPPHLLGTLAAGFSRGGRAGGRKGSAARSAQAVRGRSAGIAKARSGNRRQRLDLIATLKAAAPWQRIRTAPAGTRLAVRPSDFRVRRYQQPQRTTTVFIVDASGSAAMHRIGEAKGALEAVLAECYVRRDRVALISFRGQQATLELPPTRSLARARRTLIGLPAGGGTPVATALDLSAQVLGDIVNSGETAVGILMTDGVANVARDGTGGRKAAQHDAALAAAQLSGVGARLLYVDTAPRPRPVSRELAAAMGARYLMLPSSSAQALPAILAGQRESAAT